MKWICENLQVFILGALAYSGLEILCRGFTHWTMFVAGGICFTLLYHIFTKNNRVSLWKNCLVGALVITGVEFFTGFIVNIVLDWNVWDYSHYPLDFMGQICLFYTALWFFLSAPVFWFSRRLKRTTLRR